MRLIDADLLKDGLKLHYQDTENESARFFID